MSRFESRDTAWTQHAALSSAFPVFSRARPKASFPIALNHVSSCIIPYRKRRRRAFQETWSKYSKTGSQTELSSDRPAATQTVSEPVPRDVMSWWKSRKRNSILPLHLTVSARVETLIPNTLSQYGQTRTVSAFVYMLKERSRLSH